MLDITNLRLGDDKLGTAKVYEVVLKIMGMNMDGSIQTIHHDGVLFLHRPDACKFVEWLDTQEGLDFIKKLVPSIIDDDHVMKYISEHTSYFCIPGNSDEDDEYHPWR